MPDSTQLKPRLWMTELNDALARRVKQAGESAREFVSPQVIPPLLRLADGYWSMEDFWFWREEAGDVLDPYGQNLVTDDAQNDLREWVEEYAPELLLVDR